MNKYEQRNKKFSQVEAWAVMQAGVQVGVIQVKYPKDGAGRVHAYVHEFGFRMLHGYAGGYGYDKTGAAIGACFNDKEREQASALYGALKSVTYDGQWQDVIKAAGFDLLQAV